MLIGFAQAQVPQHRWWYFGAYAGADMDMPAPVSVANGALDTEEGVASIADAAGQLLFYTNGVQVWDRTHAVMPHGTGLEGHRSATQSALIVPFPDDPQRYYLFTVPAEMATSTGGWSGLSWSEVDMTANGGLGDVVLANVHLVASVTEKLTATRHANGRDIWVVVHGWSDNVYHAYLVTCAGIQGPVSTAVGRVMELDEAGTYNPSIGCMQFDPGGTRLAAAWGAQTLEGTGMGQMDVLRFDNATGVFSDARSITHAGADHSGQSYGVCFSPSGERLYLSEFGWVGGSFTSRVLQYTTTAPDPVTTEVTVATSLNRAYATMQKAPDGTIYIARRTATFLSRITQPDLAGTACNVVENALDLGAATSTFGLPNQWDTHPGPFAMMPGPDLHDVTLCGDEEVVLDATLDGAPFAEFRWNTGATTPTLPVTEAGTYSVEIILGCDTVRDTAVVDMGGIPVDLGPDRILCDGDSLVLAAPSVENALYLWSTGSTDTSITISRGGGYSVRIFDEDGCVTGDTLQATATNCQCVLHVPNAFTPNDDGINDGFAPRCDCLLRNYQLTIFDRWGQEAFRSDTPDEEWDGRVLGTPSPPTVMDWMVQYEYFTGNGYRHAESTGSVTVLR